MTYRSRGRSISEVVVAVTFVGFLTGFVAVLCIGNYFRAKRAMERQRQRRLARLAGGGGNGRDGVVESPRSIGSSSQYSSEEHQHLLQPKQGSSSVGRRNTISSSPMPPIGLNGDNNLHYRTQQLNPQRSKPFDEEEDSLRLQQEKGTSEVLSV